jgi:hypothetical protein
LYRLFDFCFFGEGKQMKRQSILIWIVVMTAGTSVYSADWQVDAINPTLTILNPNGDERLLAGSTYTIMWEDSGSEVCGGNYLLDYSINDGNSWIPVDSNPVSNTCAYDWLIPSIFSNQCLIRITDANDPNASDKSDDSFRIYRCMSNVLGDWNGDCYVEFGDFSIIAAGWNVPGGTDMNDLASFVQYWLDCANPYDPYCRNFGEPMPEFPADGVLIYGEEMQYLGDDYLWTKLIFIPGATAVEHTGYFNEDYSKVESRHQDANLGSPPYAYAPGWEYTLFAGNPQVPPANQTLVRGTKYYWTVDATDALGNTFASVIWEFTFLDFKAMLPNPPNEATLVEMDVLLSWLPGIEVHEHDVYLGTNFDDVNNSQYRPGHPEPPVFLDTVEEPNILVTGLSDNTTYYWRVDEIFMRCPMPCTLSLYKGDVWEFTTISVSAEPNFPADGVVIPGQEVHYLGDDYIWTKLIFFPGATAVEHTGYFSEDYNDVAARVQDANLGSPPYASYPGWEYTLFAGNPQVPPADQTLVRGHKYYWTVDETDAHGNTFGGDIWEFTILDFKAMLPNPPNEATLVETDVLLSWLPGYVVDEHDVYMGTSWEDVNNARYDAWNQPPEFLATRSEQNIAVTSLALNTTYYWRVDEVSDRCPMPCSPDYYIGDVWCFTTAPSALNNDGSINLKDYAIPPNHRQKTGPILPALSHKDDLVDYKDLRILIPPRQSLNQQE